ncbi:MAG TPA: energy transducer TonB [Casimicrobiaceae bacterium]|nr:energy transducer TonB [Casimicrobiaceae bacterium]
MLMVRPSAMLGRPSATPVQRLWLSFAASLFAHAITLAVFAGMLLPAPTSVSVKLGDPAVMQVQLPGPQPAEALPEPAATVEVAPQRPVVEPAKTPSVVAAKPQEPPPEPPIPVRHIDLRAPAAHSTDAAIPVESTPGALGSDTPIPPGDVAVGAVETAEPLGHAQALRLAQRFPQSAASPPQLREPLAVPYPPRAARAHREARIWALLIIDADGSAMEATLQPDDSLFGPTVEDALRGAKFKPAEVDARPVTHWLLLQFVFTMRSPPSKAAAQREQGATR